MSSSLASPNQQVNLRISFLNFLKDSTGFDIKFYIISNLDNSANNLSITNVSENNKDVTINVRENGQKESIDYDFPFDTFKNIDIFRGPSIPESDYPYITYERKENQNELKEKEMLSEEKKFNESKIIIKKVK